MAFWKPGSQPPTSSAQDRAIQSEESTLIPYNPHKSLGIQAQRQRLPITRYRSEILYLLEKHRVVVVVGSTGCGKTTQIPQYLVESGWATKPMMVCVTQPRRVAAMTVCARVAEEMGTQVGVQVGYAIRFDEQVDPHHTRIKFMTDGLLMRECMMDPLLSKYSVVMVDEAHERSVHTDILLALLKKVLRKRKDLRVIVSSATVDAEMFVNYFDLSSEAAESGQNNEVGVAKPAALSVEGQMYPVDIHYLHQPCVNYFTQCLETVLTIHRTQHGGDILVFLTGSEEIEMFIEELRSRQNEVRGNDGLQLKLVPLFAGLTYEMQMKAFQQAGRGFRKCIVATNIAETSITLPNISYVVDCGFCKQRWYNANSALDALMIVPVSQAMAQQRAGRAGRVSKGKAYRMYTEETFLSLEPNTTPEIQRTSLAPVVLHLKGLGIRDILHFDFVSAPPSRSMARALELLIALEAINEQVELTDPVGVRMVELPLEPMMAKMLIASEHLHCSQEICTIAAMVQIQSPFVIPSYEQRDAAEEQHRKFIVTEGDHLTLLNIYNGFITHTSKSAAVDWCKKCYLNYKALSRAVEIRRQLVGFMKKFKIKLESCADVNTICKCIAAGFFSQAAQLIGDNEYRTVKDGLTMTLHPNSVVFRCKLPAWVVYHDCIHTSKVYMRDVTAIDPKWLPELAPHFYHYERNTSTLPHETVGDALKSSRPPVF